MSYEDGRLEKICTDDREMRKKRSDLIRCLPLRIKALETATSLADLATHDPLGRWHQLTADLDGLWAGKLTANIRLVVRPEGTDDAQTVTAVTVIDITDYHG